MRSTSVLAVAGCLGLSLSLSAQPPELAAPRLLRPAPNARTAARDFFFHWYPVPQAATYQIQVASTESFSEPLIADARVEGDRHYLRLPLAGTLWWRVRALGSRGVAGPWSEARSFEVLPPPLAESVIGLTLTPSSVVGGDPSQGMVTLAKSAPAGGASVVLSASDSSNVKLPARVIVEGSAQNAMFTVSTSTAPEGASVRISAASKETTRTVTLTILPPGPPAPLTSFALNPPTVTGGSPVEGILTLAAAAPAPAGAEVRISTSDATLVSIPETVKVPRGASAATFQIQTAWATSSHSVTITATLADVTRSATLTVNHGGGLEPLVAPLPLRPPERVVVRRDQAIEFAWSSVAGAASYTIQIDASGAFEEGLILNQTVPETRLVLSQFPDKPLWWRVRANDDHGGAGIWSDPRSLRVQ